MFYVVFNINEDIIGVADSEENAVWIHQQKYGESEWDYADTYDGGRYINEYHYLFALDRIREFELNKFYYQ